MVFYVWKILSPQVAWNTTLGSYYSYVLAEDESVAVCYAYRVGAVGKNDYSRPRLLKVTLNSELISRKHLLRLLFYFTEIIPYQIT